MEQSDKTTVSCLATCSLPRKGLFTEPISSTINMQLSVHISQRNKSVVLLSSIKMTGEVEAAQSSNSEIIKYYNKTKGSLDTMDKMLGE